MLSNQVYAASSPMDMRIHTEVRAKRFRDTFPACHFRLRGCFSNWFEGESSALGEFEPPTSRPPNQEAQFQKRFLCHRLWDKKRYFPSLRATQLAPNWLREEGARLSRGRRVSFGIQTFTTG
jgi:hypothetical protein